MARLENIRETTNVLDHDCIMADFSVPHPAAQVDPTDRRRVPISIHVLKEELGYTTVSVRFNRFEVPLTKIIKVLAEEELTTRLFYKRYLGLATPLVQTKYESDLIWDKKHDEDFTSENK